ncbi:MAG: PQQ-binding-like beta-propeller repeat protein [Planctomycetes bacterium]|nr:PQQ-binding-like beta-propeller repeat protein [Planctomycetota bacterium]
MDERLRALGRLAAHDREASWARLRALSRARGRRELLFDLARLAREGDVAAGEALAGWSPLGPAPGAPAPTGEVLAAPRVIEAAWLDPMTVLAASADLWIGHRGVGQGWGRLAAISPDAPAAPRWVADTGGAVAWRGDDLVHATPRSRAGGEVVARDARTGEVVGRTPVAGRVWALAVEGDRGLLKVGDPPGPARHVCFDAGEAAFGRTLWTLEAPFEDDVHLGGGRVLRLQEAPALVSALDLDGRPLWARAVGDDLLPAARLDRALLFADAAGVVLHAAGQGAGRGATAALDPRTGEVLWARQQGAGGLPTVGPTLVLVGDGTAGPLAALDRASGATAWEAATPPVAAARASEALVVLARAAGRASSAAVLDARTGALLAAGALDVRGSPALSALASSAEGVVVASTPGRLALVRAARR